MSDLYATDFIARTQTQSAALRDLARTSNAPLDREHVIEEIEGLGACRRNALAREPRATWRISVASARAEIESSLANDPGLRPRPAEILSEEWPRARRLAVTELRACAENEAVNHMSGLDAGPFTPGEIPGDWFADDPAP